MIKDGPRRLERIEDEACEYFDCYFIHAPHYTPHGKEHSKHITNYIDDFPSTYSEIELNDYEEFLLKCGAWLHDIGMFVRKDEEETHKDIRDNHHKRSKRLIERNKNVFGFDDFEANAVSTISFLHSRTEDIKKELDDRGEDGVLRKDYRGQSFEVDLKKLAVVLRLLDSCDRAGRSFNYEKVLKDRKVPKAAMYHYVHDCINDVVFTEGSVILHTLVPSPNKGERTSQTEKMIDVLVKNEIEGEIDSIKPILDERNWQTLYSLRVEHRPDRSRTERVPTEIADKYTEYLEFFKFKPIRGYVFREAEKSVCIQKNGHTIVDFIGELVVIEEEGISTIRHMFEADESSPPDFRGFPPLETMKNTPFQKRWRNFALFADILDSDLEEEVRIENVEEEKGLISPLRGKRFAINFDRTIEKNKTIKYGVGYSAQKYFNVNEVDKEMRTSHYFSTKTDMFSLLLKLERGLEAKDFRVVLRDKNGIPLFEDTLPSNHIYRYSQKIYDGAEGRVEYGKEKTLYYTIHKIKVSGSQENRSIELNWNFA